MMYHLLRIESVKEAILSLSYPSRIYPLFFNGYGYGSPLFYPDIFLIPAAILRILGISIEMTWKIFSLMVCAAVSLSTYFSFKYICKDWRFALAGTNLVLLSEFYLADIIDRVGLSEYIAFIFIPILLAAIYDYFENNAQKCFLFIIAATGLLLSHTIMTFIGILVTALLFLSMLFIKSKRNLILKNFGKLLTCLSLSVALCAFYLFPMLEQFLSDSFRVSTPWAHVSQYSQPLESFFYPVGYFDYIAKLGIGIPILLLLGIRLAFKKNSTIWGDIFLLTGLFLFLISSELFPWKLLDNTIFNSIQFTYRFYPYAICLTVLGLMLCFTDRCQEVAKKLVLFTIISSMFFGLWQNKTAFTYSGDNVSNISPETLLSATNLVGAGEWLPMNVDEEVVNLNSSNDVSFGSGSVGFQKIGYNSYSFETSENVTEYIIPLIYYKGYSATIDDTSLPVSESACGLVTVTNNNLLSGTVNIEYSGTLVQKLSNAISIISIIGIIVYPFIKKRRNK